MQHCFFYIEYSPYFGKSVPLKALYNMVIFDDELVRVN